MPTNILKPRILIVDDEPDIAEVLSALLEGAFDCEVCTEGSTALMLLQQNSYDALITDLEMPDIPGLELIDKAKALSKDLKIFIITGHGTDHPLVRKAHNLQIAATLQKPFGEPDAVIRILGNHLKKNT